MHYYTIGKKCNENYVWMRSNSMSERPGERKSFKIKLLNTTINTKFKSVYFHNVVNKVDYKTYPRRD